LQPEITWGFNDLVSVVEPARRAVAHEEAKQAGAGYRQALTSDPANTAY
jgi:hypothetical protein